MVHMENSVNWIRSNYDIGVNMSHLNDHCQSQQPIDVVKQCMFTVSTCLLCNGKMRGVIIGVVIALPVRELNNS